MKFPKKENSVKKRKYLPHFITLLAAALLLVADQVIKYYVLLYLRPVGSVTVIPKLLEFTYVENTGVAFGLFKDRLWIVMCVTAIAAAIIVVLLFWYKNHSFLSYTVCALILAGGIGNLIDRALYGFVVDFIHVMFFDYVFNFADCCITVGAVLFAIYFLFFADKKEEALKEADEDEEKPSENTEENV